MGSGDRYSPSALQPTAAEINRQLRRIVASPDFETSERNTRFLCYVVECTLKQKNTSGYDVATRIFGREKSFDGSKDPIVRLEAGKLRLALEVYYLKSGKHDPVLIELAKGRYRALFSRRQPAAAKDLGGAPVSEVLLAVLEGWTGDKSRAKAAWRKLQEKFPDIFFNPEVHRTLQLLHGDDERLRKLLLEGLQRSARTAR